MKFKSAIFLLSVFALQSAFAGDFIVGGSEVPANDPIARSTVALVMNGAEGQSLCTGSLIESDLVVTAAHCLADQPSSVFIVFSNRIDAASAQDTIPAGRFAINPAYRGDQMGPDQNDIAVIEFHGGLPSGYEPVRVLRDENLLKNGQDVVLAGFGIDNAESQAGAGVLRQTTVEIADGSFGKTEILLSQREGRGACHGDSGGPAFLKIGSKLYLWGVTSRAYPNSAPDDCAHESVYTKIEDHLQFLNESAAALRR